MAENEQEIMATVARIFAEVSEVDVDDVLPEKTLREDLDIDSLSMAELGVALQDRFDMELTDEQVFGLRTVSDVVSLIHSAQVAA